MIRLFSSSQKLHSNFILVCISSVFCLTVNYIYPIYLGFQDLDSSKNDKRRDAEGDHPVEVKELSRSKWSNDLDEDEIEGPEAIKGNLNAFSGLIQAYKKKGKSVHWSDQVFLILQNIFCVCQ